MLYREMGGTGEKVSILGFGCMRLPTRGKNDYIDEKSTTHLLDYALDHGINYLDTAYPYQGLSFSDAGSGELFLGKYLAENERHDEVHLATKLPTWLVEDGKDMEKYLTEQLQRLKTDCIDFYLLHALKQEEWVHLENLGILEFLDSAVSDGRIKYTGFSSHEETGFIKEVIDSYQWDICQIQYNYLDENIQAGQEGLQHAAKQGLGIVIMEPLKGGALASNIPPEVQAIWDNSSVLRNPVEWALRYLWDIPHISVVLSGMNTMEQLKENLKYAEKGLAGTLSQDEMEIMEEVKKVYNGKIAVECSGCGYCIPCPNNINIPQCFSHLNQAAMLRDFKEVIVQYDFLINDAEKAKNCRECGLCEDICSQKIPIREKLKEVVNKLGS